MVMRLVWCSRKRRESKIIPRLRRREDKVREVLLKVRLLWVVLLRGLGEISVKSAWFAV